MRRVVYDICLPTSPGNTNGEHRDSQVQSGSSKMVERRKELDARYQRKKKLNKLKARLASAKDGRERETVLKKIHKISPWWSEPKKA